MKLFTQQKKKICNEAFQEIAMRCWSFPWLVNYSKAQFCVRLTTIGSKFWAILQLGTWSQKPEVVKSPPWKMIRQSPCSNSLEVRNQVLRVCLVIVFCFCSQKLVFVLFSNFESKMWFSTVFNPFFLFGDCFQWKVFIYNCHKFHSLHKYDNHTTERVSTRESHPVRATKSLH